MTAPENFNEFDMGFPGARLKGLAVVRESEILVMTKDFLFRTMLRQSESTEFGSDDRNLSAPVEVTC